MRIPETLAKLVSKICREKTVDAFGISEVFNIASDELRQRIQEIMLLIVDELNVDSFLTGSAQPVWTGKADVHYIFVWNTNALTCNLYEVISCGIQEHGFRKAQYFQFVMSSDGDTLHVFHNHSPSPNLTDGRRKRICSTFWHHVAGKSSAEQPAVVFGGDFNCSPVMWGLCFKELMSTQSARRTVQLCRSQDVDGHREDNAIAMNVRAIQETSRFGFSWLNGHDVVLVPLHWRNRREAENSAAQPALSSPTREQLKR